MCVRSCDVARGLSMGCSMACSIPTGLEKFEEMNAAGLAAVDVTTAYQEKFSEVVVKF